MEFQEKELTVDVSVVVEQIILSRQISYQQYHQLSAAILADGKVDEAERSQINRLFDAIQSGRVRIVN